MPSRRAILLIVLIWLAAIGWTVYRDVWERGQPPPLALDLVAEIGAENGTWDVYKGRERVGSARTEVRRPARRPLELRCFYSLDRLHFRGLTVKSLSSTYGITPRGAMRYLTARVTLNFFWGRDQETEIGGRSEGGFFTPQLQRGGIVYPEQVRVAVASRGQVLNVLHPLHKMARLRPGQTWRIPLLDPLTVATAVGPEGRTVPTPVAVALVETEAVEWEGNQVACWRIDYGLDSGRVAARVWARIPDGMVLRHEANPGGAVIVLVRKQTL